jgi:hypothetical protein
MNRPVYVLGHALFASPGPGRAVVGFDPIAAGVPRKHLKTMTRSVQLGVAAVSRALQTVSGWEEVPPERRGLYVGASPQSGDPEDLASAVEATGADFSPSAFAERGVPLIPPLWLVKGLSNNVLGYASAQHDLRGDNGNWCDGRLGGAVALAAAVCAVAEGRVDLAIAGAADALVEVGALLGRPGGEAAAFIVVSARGPGREVRVGTPSDVGAADDVGELGAAAVPVAVVRALTEGRTGPIAGGLTLF